MSAGAPHSRPNLKHPRELKKLLSEGDAPELMQRWQRVDVDHDIPYLAGYNVDGTVRYLDRDFFHALKDPQYAAHLGIGPIDTGLSVDDTIECLMEHEAIEKVILDADNPIDVYDQAHEYATSGEHEQVRNLGGKPIQYERGLKKAIAFCAKKDLQEVPQDYSCGPALDDDDEKILKKLRMLQIPDAFKVSKADVDYSSATSDDQCAGCVHWQDDPQQQGFGLGRCELVCGLVRGTQWCRKFEAAQQEEADDDGEVEGADEEVGEDSIAADGGEEEAAPVGGDGDGTAQPDLRAGAPTQRGGVPAAGAVASGRAQLSAPDDTAPRPTGRAPALTKGK